MQHVLQPVRESSETDDVVRVGLIGARGHVGKEIIRLTGEHPQLRLAFATSREQAGERVPAAARHDLLNGRYVATTPDVCEMPADVYILALPNGMSAPYVQRIDAEYGSDPVIIDMSADHRCNDAWVYGIPEINASAITTSKRIANPGCYATAMMLGLAPVAALFDDRPPAAFGVSGYTGAGTTPSDRNDVDLLHDNLLPYQLADHVHEREVARHLGRSVYFTPHVASFARGISLTITATLEQAATTIEMLDSYPRFYGESPLIHVSQDVPRVRAIAGTTGAVVGGISVSERDPHRLSLVVTLDNLLKGAASQAVQNLNLACGLPIGKGVTT